MEKRVYTFSQTSKSAIRIDCDRSDGLRLFKTGHNQWILYAAESAQPAATFHVSRIKSSVFWCKRIAWNYAERDLGLTTDCITYKIDPRRTIKWSRATRALDVSSGSTVWPRAATIDSLSQSSQPHFSASMTLNYSGGFDLEIIISAFIAMILWNKDSVAALVRAKLQERALISGKQMWGKLAELADCAASRVNN